MKSVWHYSRERIKPSLKKIFLSAFLLFTLSPCAWANNLRITNVSLQDRDQTANTAIVQFDISWDNSWRNTTNHDAAWVVFKVKRTATVDDYSCHGPMKTAGLKPAHTSAGTDTNLEIYVPSDKTGAFIRRKATGSGTVNSKKVRLMLDFGSMNSFDGSYCAVTASTPIQVTVVGVEMVFIPTTSFKAGTPSCAAGAETAAFNSGGSCSNPWFIADEGTITTTGSTNTAFYYTYPGTAMGGTSPYITGSVFTLPSAFPKGYAADYAMKYEITEGLYCDFMNSLNPTQQAQHDITAASGKNSDSVVNRNTVSMTSTCATSRPDRAISYLNWDTFAAIMDWLALRPMTELEYEKMSRGPATPVAGEFAWGDANTVRNALSFAGSPELGNETVATAAPNPNIVIGNATFTEGDAYLGAAYQTGPTRPGIFATSTSTRATSGSGYYGNMELSGNLWEYVVSVGTSWPQINPFTGKHGDGTIGTGGHASISAATPWPGTNGSGLVVYGSDSGLRGASWAETSVHRARVADRFYAVASTNSWGKDFGGRGVRTYDGTDF
jgi:formylglycine-generating enzyme required for sulfatase activity